MQNVSDDVEAVVNEDDFLATITCEGALQITPGSIHLDSQTVASTIDTV